MTDTGAGAGSPALRPPPRWSGRATFNTSTGQFEIAARYNVKTAPSTFSVLLRDGSRHTVQVQCDVVW